MKFGLPCGLISSNGVVGRTQQHIRVSAFQRTKKQLGISSYIVWRIRWAIHFLLLLLLCCTVIACEYQMEFAMECLATFIPPDVSSIILSYVPNLTLHWAAAVQPNSGTVTTMTSVGHDKIAIGFQDGTIRINDCFTGLCIRALTEHTSMIVALICCGNKQLASASYYGPVRIWNVETGECMFTTDYPVNAARINFAVLSSGDLAASISELGKGPCVRVWTQKAYRLWCEFPTKIHTQALMSFIHNTLVVSCGNKMLLYDAHGALIDDVSLYNGNSFWPNSEVKLLALAHSTFASIAHGTLLIWQFAGGFLAQVKCLEMAVAEPCAVVVCMNSIVMTTWGMVVSKFDMPMQVYVALHDARHPRNEFTIPTTPVKQMIALPNGRVITEHSKRVAHIWTLGFA